MPETTSETWAVVELLGHLKLAGRLTEEEKFGSKLGRLDIPFNRTCEACAGTGQAAFMSAEPCPSCKGTKVESGFMTRYFGGASVYSISVVSEEVARHVAQVAAPAPVSQWDFPKRALPAPEDRDDEYDDESEES